MECWFTSPENKLWITIFFKKIIILNLHSVKATLIEWTHILFKINDTVAHNKVAMPTRVFDYCNI